MSIEIRPAGGRSVTRVDGRETLHSFAFGAYYDPANTGFAAMVALNDENLPPGTGYDEHPHRDTEIVTWVLSGALRHTDAAYGSRVLGPGDVLCTSAGSGITHSEVADSAEPTRFLQTWLRPDVPGLAPVTTTTSFGQPDGLREAVGPDGLDIGTSGARLFLGTVTSGDLVLPEAERLHLFVVHGCTTLGDRSLGPGDAARLESEGGRILGVNVSATVAVWAFSGS